MSEWWPELLRPGWLLLVPLGPWLVWRLRRSGPDGPWARVCDRRLLPWVLDGRGSRRRGTGLAATVWVLLCLALAGPSLERVMPAGTAATARVLLLELPPDPAALERGRHAATVLLDAAPATPTGLAVYGDAGFRVSPVSEDPALLRHYLPALSPELLPHPGQRPERGLATAAALLAGAGRGPGEIVLIASGTGSATAAGAAVDELRAAGHRLSVVDTGAVASPTLRALAGAGGGRYAHGGPWPASAWAEVAGAGSSAMPLPRDDGPWLLLIAMALLVAAAARGATAAWRPAVAALAVLALAALPTLATPPAAAAAVTEDTAAMLEGVDHYRAGRWQAAEVAFARAGGASGHYNRGNALARLGRLEEAVAAYEAALARDPGLDDASHNRALVHRALQARDTAGAGLQGGGLADDVDAGGDTAGSGAAVDTLSIDDHTTRGEGGAGGDGGNAAGDATTQRAPGPTADAADRGALDAEIRQTLETWWRQIEDDTTALLRNRFRVQSAGSGREPGS